jgi:hypothetical protein
MSDYQKLRFAGLDCGKPTGSDQSRVGAIIHDEKVNFGSLNNVKCDVSIVASGN